MEKIICIRWDSITMGARDLEKWGRANRLHFFLKWKSLEENWDYSVAYNLGIDWDTSTGIMKRFDIEAEAREPNVIMFAIGANDCTYKEWRTYTVEPNDFRKNIITVIDKAKQYTDTIVIIWLILCDETKMMPIPRVPELSLDMKGIIVFNTILKEVAIETWVLFIDMLDVIHKEDLEDWCHPNTTGHEKMFIRIKDVLLNKKII